MKRKGAMPKGVAEAVRAIVIASGVGGHFRLRYDGVINGRKQIRVLSTVSGFRPFTVSYF
jgi:hypothetical protein